MIGLSCCSLASSLDAAQEADAESLPPLLDSDDIAYFFEKNEIDSLHWALRTIFERSQRNPDAIDPPPLPEQLVARGGGLTYTTAYKVQHDLEQALYLAEKLKDETHSAFFRDIVAPIYEVLLRKIPPVDQLTRTQGLYALTAEDRETLPIESIYNEALYHPSLDELKDGAMLYCLYRTPVVRPRRRKCSGAACRYYCGRRHFVYASPSGSAADHVGIDSLVPDQTASKVRRLRRCLH